MAKNIESYVKSIESLIRAKYFQGDVTGIIIGTTGDRPFSNYDIDELIGELGGIVTNSIPPEDQKYIVIGRECYSEVFLTMAVECNEDVIFLSQERFINYILFGAIIDNQCDEEEITNHAGLSYVRDIGGFSEDINDLFSKYAVETPSGPSTWKDKSFLRDEYGYHTGMLPSERKEHLTRAVHNEGLSPVVKHISWLITLNMGNKRIKDAVNSWIKDLDWLKHTYHGREGNDFIWPEY
ncbi:MAG: hypothetical protein WC405_09075 [Syntrophales bacterium]